MSDLTFSEKQNIERLLGMGDGYVLDFSNRTFEEFVFESTGREIYDDLYNYGSGSKANRLRGFWKEEDNYTVGKLLNDLLDYGEDIGAFQNDAPLLADCRKIATRLIQDSPVSELDALTPITDERDFETVAKTIRGHIEKNEPEVGLDRLHTFIVKFVRSLCQHCGIDIDPETPLHSLFGQYVKKIREGGFIESIMTERILKMSISILEAFNHVRNKQSLAHDNPILNYDEALLIFNHVASSVRFLRSLNRRVKNIEERKAQEADDLLL